MACVEVPVVKNMVGDDVLRHAGLLLSGTFCEALLLPQMINKMGSAFFTVNVSSVFLAFLLLREAKPFSSFKIRHVPHALFSALVLQTLTTSFWLAQIGCTMVFCFHDSHNSPLWR